MLRHKVNKEECIQCGLCIITYPEKFGRDAGGEVILINNITDEEKEICSANAIEGENESI